MPDASWNIVLVDDDSRILDGLRRMLRPYRKEWRMRFVRGGGEALELMRHDAVDMLVTDMRMPGMNGVELMKQVRTLYPHVIRMVLSGHVDEKMAMESMGVAHRYLAKPCDGDVLRKTILEMLKLHEILRSPRLRSIVSGLPGLPVLPSTCDSLAQELRSPEHFISGAAEIIARDAAMTAKILHVVNSVFGGKSREIVNIMQAVSSLGNDAIGAMILPYRTFKQFDAPRMDHPDLEAIFRHSRTVGKFARIIAREECSGSQVEDEAFLGGLLHDIGKLILAAALPDLFGRVQQYAAANGVSSYAAETELIGAGHPEIGAYLLGLWGFPGSVVDAVLYHHDPEGNPGFGALVAVWAADCIAYDLAGKLSGPVEASLKIECLDDLKSRYGHWRKSCDQARDGL